jgi:hypothetical protein
MLHHSDKWWISSIIFGIILTHSLMTIQATANVIAAVAAYNN